MSPEAWILGAVLGILLMFWFLWKGPAGSIKGQRDQGDRQARALEKERIYKEIQDLEYDFRTGKMNRRDYDDVRAELVREAAVILRNLEGPEAEQDLDRDIEDWVADTRGKKS